MFFFARNFTQFQTFIKRIYKLKVFPEVNDEKTRKVILVKGKNRE